MRLECSVSNVKVTGGRMVLYSVLSVSRATVVRLILDCPC